MSNQLALPPPSTVPELALAKWVRSLFLTGEQGAWYDPSDLSTLYQDAAGTTPVTAVEQPVGRMLDKSGRGNHATQTTAASRPVLSARYNLLTETEFRNGLTDAPTRGGLVTASTMTGYAGAIAFGANQDSYAYKSAATTAGVTYKISAIVEMSDGQPPVFGSSPSADGSTFAFVIHGDSVTSAASQTYEVSQLSAGVYRVSAKFVALKSITANSGIVKYATNNNRTFKVTAYQLTVTNSLPDNRYQRVNTATDYDTVGFRPYLRFDGVDDFLVTPSIDFTVTDKMTVFAGVRKLSDATVGMVAELSSSVSSFNGSFFLAAPISTAGQNNFNSKGTLPGSATTGAFLAPITNTLTGIGDISGDQATLRINGTQAATSTADQGTGTYGNYPLYIGRRGGTSLPFNGHLYSLIVRGAQSSDAQIRAAEAWVNNRTGAY